MKHDVTGSRYLRLVCSTWNKFFKQNGAFKRAILDVLDENERLKIENAVLRSKLNEPKYIHIPCDKKELI